MRNARSLLLLALLAAVATLAPAAAGAQGESPAAIVTACHQHDYALPGHYGIAALRAAYDSISPASREYSTCAQVIQSKITSILTSQHITPSGGGGGSGFPVVIVVIAVIVVLGGGGAFYSYRRSRQ